MCMRLALHVLPTWDFPDLTRIVNSLWAIQIKPIGSISKHDVVGSSLPEKSNYFLCLKEENTMPANKNALIRYRTIDNCLRNRYRRWTLDDLVQACCDALYDMEGIKKGVCARTVQMDMQIMRSDKLGYKAPIEVYDKIYYRYADPDYSISDMPLSIEDCKLLKKAITLLSENNREKTETIEVLEKVKIRLLSILNFV